jgi:hypothetical protein
MAGYRGVEVLISIAIALLLTWLLLLAAVAIRRPKMLHLEAAYRRFSATGDLSGRNRRLRLTLLVLAMLIVVNAVWLGLLLSRAPGEQAVDSTSTESGTPGGGSSSAGPSPASAPGGGSAAEEEAIQVEHIAHSARPFEAVRIQGTYRGGADTFLRVQRWEQGKWLAFPVPTKTDHAGQFTAHVEFEQPGAYRLRLLDPGSGATSKPFVLVIEG